MPNQATRVLAFPGIDLDRLAELRAQASDAFLREDAMGYQHACMTMRKLIGGQDASATDPRSYRHRSVARQVESLAQRTRDRHQ